MQYWIIFVKSSFSDSVILSEMFWTILFFKFCISTERSLKIAFLLIWFLILFSCVTKLFWVRCRSTKAIFWRTFIKNGIWCILIDWIWLADILLKTLFYTSSRTSKKAVLDLIKKRIKSTYLMLYLCRCAFSGSIVFHFHPELFAAPRS